MEEIKDVNEKDVKNSKKVKVKLAGHGSRAV
jgi:hypothetical protein